MKNSKKIVIKKRSLYTKKLFTLIGTSVFLVLFLCAFIAIVNPFFDVPTVLKVTCGIPLLFLSAGMLFGVIDAVKKISTIKSSLQITDAVVVNKYKKISSATEDFSYVYHVKLKYSDTGIIDVTVDSFLYDEVEVRSICYYFNVSDCIYPKDHYVLGDDLLPFYNAGDQ